MALHFIALSPPEEMDQWLTHLKNECNDLFGASKALNSPAHITLIPPFHPHEEVKLDRLFSAFHPGIPPFPIEICGMGHFRNAVIYVAVEKSQLLQKLYDRVQGYFNGRQGIKSPIRSFHPHMTIAFRDLEKEIFQEAWNHFNHKVTPESFIAERISLLKHNGKKWEIKKSLSL